MIMRKITKYSKAIKYSHYAAMLLTALLLFVCLPGLQRYEEAGANLVSIFVNGTQVGTIGDAKEVDEMLLEARRRVSEQYNGLVLIDSNVVLSGSTDVIGTLDDKETIINNICDVYTNSIMKTKQPAYEVKINEFTVNLKSIDEVLTLLERAKSEYDTDGEWNVELVVDPTRELNVLTTKVTRNEEAENEEGESSDQNAPVKTQAAFPVAGALLRMEQIYNGAFLLTTDPYEFGITNLDFGENVEVVQAYVDADKIVSLEDAIEMVTKTQEKKKIYEVVSGDTLAGVAQKNDMTVADILALNSQTLSSASSMLRIGDELTVSSPEPELSVVRTERRYYEESYDADVVYIDNDEWYTTQSEVRVQPTTGFRKVIANLTYRNSELTNTDIVYEDVVIEAVAKVVERGTKTPPTFLKPVSGGRLSSGFGRRKSPTKGASTYHKGVDWAVPVGTAVVASMGGTVIRAGWGSGYGYCVYIQHPDGQVTRYGHLSKVLVKSGQKVSQGEKIALSGNTGVSSGPHLHFEILINGTQVNPLNYL